MTALEIIPAVFLVFLGLVVGIGILVAAARIVRQIAPHERKDAKK
jgi:energy-converting hydrogenase Eha subunit F